MGWGGISADAGLRQGRGGAWDHRRCGTCPVGPPLQRPTCLSHAFLRAFKAAVCSFEISKPFRKLVSGNHFRSYRPQPCVFLRRSRLPFGRPQTLRRSRLPFGRPQTHQTPQTLPQAYMPQPGPSHVFFYGVRDCCRLVARKPVKPVKPLHRPTCLSQAPAMCCFTAFETAVDRPQTHQTP